MTQNSYPSLPEFDYIRPQTLMEASQFLAKHPTDARPFLGGTDCFVRMRDRVWKVNYLVDLKQLPGMKEIRTLPGEGLEIGAAVNMNKLIENREVREHFPVLVQAASQVGGYQLRSRATVVGNICNASPCGDTIGPCLAYDSILVIHTDSTEKKLPLKDFFLGPGRTRLTPGEVVKSIFLSFPPRDMKGIYLSIGRNALGDLASVAVTVLGWSAKDAPSGHRFRIYLSAVAPTVISVPAAEKFLADHKLTDGVIDQAASIARETCKPIDDIRSGKEYRRAMVRELTKRALQNVLEQLQGKSKVGK
jgi:carbon-monoxide dehydrogenase medium subunit